ncbi:MAG: 50S ribosomal protein L11 methyltransferase [Flavobacteriales bacterium]|nr:50S ribosomal protein L11 methyltransferase [Flavobacteriales bacterium]
MAYTVVNFLLEPVEPWRDLLLVELMELGYEGFEETTGGLKAYIPTAEFHRADLDRLQVVRDPHVSISRSVSELPEVNWNAQWESGFQPVEVDGRVRVRAEFHAAVDGFEHDVVITPRMAFGTGHHATTRMMVVSMLRFPLLGQRVCDLGCGTGVLAILAERLGAVEVVAIDHDPVAVENARYNAQVNHCTHVTVENGGTDLQAGAGYGTILANIERNTLITAMPAMAAALKPGGHLLLSGFVVEHLPHLLQAAAKEGLHVVQQLEEGEWAFLRVEKPQTSEPA